MADISKVKLFVLQNRSVTWIWEERWASLEILRNPDRQTDRQTTKAPSDSPALEFPKVARVLV